MKHHQIYQLTLTALLACMICLFTLAVQIPLPGTGGYANLGDGILLCSAYLLSPGYAVAAASIGSVLADLLSGYIVYAPCTLLIKGGMALIVSLLSKRKNFGLYLSACVMAEIVMVAGYCVYDAVVLSYGAGAWMSVPGNLLQGLVGIAVALVLVPITRKWIEKRKSSKR